eukprot:1156865-Pelagomonas_calceolata.AAC.2
MCDLYTASTHDTHKDPCAAFTQALNGRRFALPAAAKSADPHRPLGQAAQPPWNPKQWRVQALLE